MIRWLKKLDSIVTIMIFTIIVGVIVITLRSRTYYIGYEIAKIKSQEKNLRIQNDELRIELTELQRHVRNSLLNEKDSRGRPKFIFPDTSHVINEGDK